MRLLRALKRLTPLAGEHESRAGAFVDAIEREYERDGPKLVRVGTFVGVRYDSTTTLDPWDTIAALESGRALLAQPPETLASAVLVAAARARETSGFGYSARGRILTYLGRKKLPFEREDARQLLRFAAEAEPATRPELLKAALHAVELVGADGLAGELHDALRKFERVADVVPASEANRLRARATALLPEDVAFALPADDNWSKRMRPQLGTLGGAGPLLRHLATATASKPSKAWSREAADLLAGHDDLIRALLEAAADAELRKGKIWQFDGETYQEEHYLAAPNAVLVKGAVWAAGVLDADWAPPLLGRIVYKAFERNDAVANACILVLGGLSDERAVRELGALQASIKHRGYQKRIIAALEAAGERAGLSTTQLLERLVPDFGLDAGGRKEVEVGGRHAVIAVESTGVSLSWRHGEKEQRTVPKEVKDGHGDELKAVKAEVAELRKAQSAERVRLESLFSEEPRWPYEDWRRYYLDHPLVGRFAHALIWLFDDEARLGVEAPERAERVELWHPVRADAPDVTRWRSRLLDEQIAQPLKQAYREVYLVAPAEEETRTYSNRFAGHVLRYPQAYALFKDRGWSGNALGPWDGGFEATVKREFRSHGLRAEFYLQLVETDRSLPLADLASTDQVRFYPLAGRDPDPVPLVDVPKLAFSEAMRDVDLFVGVASIAADPTWLDRGEERYNEYWLQTAFGELAASAEGRREALRELVPRLKIADRCELDERHLIVRGDLGTYKIHLGSANVMMEPDRYLCIVPAPGAGKRLQGKVFLPFEGDGRLVVILSKAFLLADDRKITDASITRQLRT